MKHFWLFMLALILCAAMALGSVSPGVTADKEGEIERLADLNTENTASASRYSVSGDRFGQVTVKDTTTGEVIRTFQMDDGVVVRETFLLDGGKTVGASQKDHAVFWDLATGREIHRFPQRIYGFSHDETKFFTWKAIEKKHRILLYSYPDMNLVCKLLPFQGVGPEKFLFSPNDRFLAVNSYTGVALSDEDYLNPPGQISGLRLTNLFDLEKCETIEEFSKLGNPGLGEFSPDSSFYVVQDALEINGRRVLGYCNFNLSNYQLENCTNTSPPPQPKKERLILYSISREAGGRVTVSDGRTGKVIRTFQMDDGVAVKETFLLDGGKTVAASQKDQTVFWDLATGREIHRFPQRIYGFTHDNTKFFTWKAIAAERKHNLLLYSYPDMKQVCKMSWAGAPEKFNLSPNDRFLAVSFYNGVTFTDEEYISPPRILTPGLRLTNIFDIQKCEVIEEFSKLGYGGLGDFSPDSSFYVVQDALKVNGRTILGSCQFNLSNYQLENCTNTSPPPQQKKERFVP